MDLKVVLNNSNEVEKLIEKGETFVLKISKSDCCYCDKINLIERSILERLWMLIVSLMLSIVCSENVTARAEIMNIEGYSIENNSRSLEDTSI